MARPKLFIAETPKKQKNITLAITVNFMHGSHASFFPTALHTLQKSTPVSM